MFDLTSGKLLLLAIVALIVLGPKDFPILLRTIGKYMGIIKRQADEFRAQFDEAMRESELEQLKKDVEGLGEDLDQSMRETERSISSDLGSITKDIDGVRSDVEGQFGDPLLSSPQSSGYTPEAIRGPGTESSTGGATEPVIPDPDAHDANGVPIGPIAAATVVAPAAPEPVPTHGDRSSLNGSGGHSAPAVGAAETAPKSGA
jgi:sec-independent protein translocase protein TatB